MTYPAITDQRKRNRAAKTLVIWRRMRDEHLRNQENYPIGNWNKSYEISCAQSNKSWAYGYRIALKDLGED